MKKIALVLCMIFILFFSYAFNMPAYKNEDSTQLNNVVEQSYIVESSTNASNSKTNILYSYSVKDSKGIERHNFDIHTPLTESPKNGFPVVITIHGGAFVMGEKEDYDYITPIILDNGCIHINMNYRLISNLPPSNDNYYLDMLDDISNLIDFIYKNSTIYNIDVNKIIIMGTSSGGNLALVYGLNNYVYEDVDDPSSNIPFRGIITEGAPMFADLMIKNGIVYYNGSSYVQDANIHNKISALLCNNSFTYDDLKIMNPLSLSSYKCKNVKLIQGTGFQYKNSHLYNDDEGDMLVPLIDALNLKARIGDKGCDVISLNNCAHSEYPTRLLKKQDYYAIFVNVLQSLIDGEE